MLVFILPFIVIAVIAKLLLPKKKPSIKGKHIVIFGGSSGIGKALAILAAKEGAHVTILARNIDKLTEAKNEIKNYCIDEEQLIAKVSVDVTNYEAVENNLGEVEAIVGPIYMLVNCAGMAICGEIENFTQQQIKTLVDVNLIGSIYSVKAIVPKFKKRREGIIILTASQVALMGMYGYSVYSSCKFALRGFAESVYQEVKPYNISVTLALPPDTDTPGFEIENQTKPKETKLLSETGGLLQPEEVAKKMLDDALSGKFFSYVGFESFILTTLCVGMSPFQSVFDVIIQSCLLGMLRIVGAFYSMYFNGIIKKCFKEKESKKDKQT
ncbi:unnamed protein product [Acanthoscelides obtectus]|uniref:3-dehydrosphinganine reductase n=1 Tax=Acanthoscelides obtectus TaxID=200917 RepID=A0A9P0KFZ6_ACAOB|nr:unnamed protein product [Acanthoscelides obtectus]CAK1628114.1 3-ketodihydrosphingosine reductase [Acanthoscelides obtectus]